MFPSLYKHKEEGSRGKAYLSLLPSSIGGDGFIVNSLFWFVCLVINTIT